VKRPNAQRDNRMHHGASAGFSGSGSPSHTAHCAASVYGRSRLGPYGIMNSTAVQMQLNPAAAYAYYAMRMNSFYYPQMYAMMNHACYDGQRSNNWMSYNDSMMQPLESNTETESTDEGCEDKENSASTWFNAEEFDKPVSDSDFRGSYRTESRNFNHSPREKTHCAKRRKDMTKNTRAFSPY